MTKTAYLNLLKEGIDKVKNFTTTTTTKPGHKTKLYELKNLYYDLMPINRYLFNPDLNEWKNYKLNLETNKTKKQLDNDLRYCLLVINRTLQEILNDTYNNNIKFDDVI